MCRVSDRQELSGHLFFRTSFIDKFGIGIFPTEGKIAPYNSQPVSILIVHEASDDNQTIKRTTDVTDSSVLTVETEEQRHVLSIAKETKLQPMSETPVLLNKSASGTAKIDFCTPFGQ